MLDASGSAPLDIIATAVTPAVMISASAILISGVNSKHASLSDRLRSLTTEYRQPNTSEERRENIKKQMRLFMRRLRIVSWAHIGLYVATAFFVAMVFAITIGPIVMVWDSILFPLFLCGIGCILASVVLEIVELGLAGRTVVLETYDAFREVEKR